MELKKGKVLEDLAIYAGGEYFKSMLSKYAYRVLNYRYKTKNPTFDSDFCDLLKNDFTRELTQSINFPKDLENFNRRNNNTKVIEFLIIAPDKVINDNLRVQVVIAEEEKSSENFKVKVGYSL